MNCKNFALCPHMYYPVSDTLPTIFKYVCLYIPRQEKKGLSEYKCCWSLPIFSKDFVGINKVQPLFIEQLLMWLVRQTWFPFLESCRKTHLNQIAVCKLLKFRDYFVCYIDNSPEQCQAWIEYTSKYLGMTPNYLSSVKYFFNVTLSVWSGKTSLQKGH